MRRILVAALLLASLAVPASAAAARPVPARWLGVSFMPEWVAERAKPSFDAELKLMKRSGVGSARFALYWVQVQPYKRMAAVPRKKRSQFRVVHGVPTDFHALDRLVAATAERRLPLAPVVLGAPRWATTDAGRPIDVPRDPAAYARFMTTLVERYGPQGWFWRSHPKVRKLPIRSWQIWNEVSNSWYWDNTWPQAYPRLLRAAYDAVKAADPRARVIQAGLNTGEGGPSWRVQDALYRQLDAQGLGRPFDELAVHIYTRKVGDAVKVVRETRNTTIRFDDGERPIRVTELAWPASHGRLRDEHGKRREFFAGTTQNGMAKRLTKGVLSLARHRRTLGIAGVDWFQWGSAYKGRHDAFEYSGLRMARRHRLNDTPAMRAYRNVAKRLRRGI